MFLLKKLHKWLSLLVGLQLFIWLSTGFFFNLMDHQKASGNQFRQSPAIAKVNKNQLVEPQVVLLESKPTVSLKQISLLEKPYYLLTHNKGLYSHQHNSYSLVDAYSGKQVIIDEVMAGEIAQASYKGQDKIISIVKLSPPYDDIPREQNMFGKLIMLIPLIPVFISMQVQGVLLNTVMMISDLLISFLCCTSWIMVLKEALTMFKLLFLQFLHFFLH